jgi:hypothetical protein
MEIFSSSGLTKYSPREVFRSGQVTNFRVLQRDNSVDLLIEHGVPGVECKSPLIYVVEIASFWDLYSLELIKSATRKLGALWSSVPSRL